MKRLIALPCLFIISVLVSPLTRADFVLGAGLYDDSAPILTYSGIWYPDYGTHFYLDYATFGVEIDASTLNFSFYGEAFTIYTARFPEGDNAIVCIDDICSNVSMYDPSTIWNVPVTFSGLGVGIHDVEIIPDLEGMYFDALYIHPITESGATAAPTATPTPTETPTLEFTETPTATPTALPWIEYQVTDEVGNEQTVRYRYETSTGEQMQIYIGFAVLILLMVLVVLIVWRHVDDAS